MVSTQVTGYKVKVFICPTITRFFSRSKICSLVKVKSLRAETITRFTMITSFPTVNHGSCCTIDNTWGPVSGSYTFYRIKYGYFLFFHRKIERRQKSRRSRDNTPCFFAACSRVFSVPLFWISRRPWGRGSLNNTRVKLARCNHSNVLYKLYRLSGCLHGGRKVLEGGSS